MIPSHYRAMWLIAMFDLPVTSKSARKKATDFRALLLDTGFIMLQYSVYGRFCESADSVDSKIRTIRSQLPSEGSVRLLSVTDRQFAKMQHYTGKKRVNTEDPPDQLLLF
ncbi:MAG: CRISPR-associated endonuclease Cas2 [Gammaproteobacteria bacterium]|nr:CRISPR-associated endonuclease Cas2 [Gammaproteobacteria bacterium]